MKNLLFRRLKRRKFAGISGATWLMSNPKAHENPVFAGPSWILTFTKVPAGKACKCENRGTRREPFSVTDRQTRRLPFILAAVR